MSINLCDFHQLLFWCQIFRTDFGTWLPLSQKHIIKFNADVDVGSQSAASGVGWGRNQKTMCSPVMIFHTGLGKTSMDFVLVTVFLIKQWNLRHEKSSFSYSKISHFVHVFAIFLIETWDNYRIKHCWFMFQLYIWEIMSATIGSATSGVLASIGVC